MTVLEGSVLPSMTRNPGVGAGLAVLSAAAFSTSGSFGSSLIEAGWSPAAAVTARVAIAAAVLTVCLLYTSFEPGVGPRFPAQTVRLLTGRSAKVGGA